MRQFVAALSLTVTGCSLVYNPSDLPAVPIDAKPDPDAEIVLDADPTRLTLERVSPAVIFEGTGSGGSRKGVITVHGKQIVQGARITIAPHAGAVGDPMITIDDAATDVSDNGFYVAAPFTIEVNPALDAPARIRLDVTVTQPTGAGDVSQTLGELPLPAPADTRGHGGARARGARRAHRCHERSAPHRDGPRVLAGDDQRRAHRGRHGGAADRARARLGFDHGDLDRECEQPIEGRGRARRR
jgi:hypothetical protein